MPDGIVVKDRMRCDAIGNYEGIRVQGVRQAILASQHIVMFDRLLAAVETAEGQGLLDAAEAKSTIRELYKND